MNQQHLIEGLNSVGPSAERLFSLLPADKLAWRPRESMRTLGSEPPGPGNGHRPLHPGRRLAGGRPGEGAGALASDPGRTGHGLARRRRGRVRVLRGLSDTEFMTREGKAFYGHVDPLWSWLLDIVTHTYHHRAQLFTYLKQLGLPVDMATLYG